MENSGKDSQEVKTEGKEIYDDDITWKPRGRHVDTQPTVEISGAKIQARENLSS